MAWPKTPYQTFLPNTTRIGAAFLNAVQAAISDLYSGGANGSLAKLLVDGIGGAAVTLLSGSVAKFTGGFVELAGSTNEYDPATFVNTAPTAFRALLKVTLPSGMFGWLYSTITGWAFTINAHWNGTVWTPDAGVAQSFLFTLDYSGFSASVHAASGTWATNAWQAQATLSGTGTLALTNTLTAALATISGAITSTAGNIVATVGNIVATAGNITATAGNIVGNKLFGDPTGTTPATLTYHDPGITTLGTFAGNDIGGTISNFAISGADLAGNLKLFEVTFSSTYGAPPAITLAAGIASHMDSGKLYAVSSATKFEIFLNVDGTLPGSGGTYTIHYNVVGI